MSKSDPENCLFLLDEPELIYKKIMGAKTDSCKGISYDRKNRKALSNLIEIMSLIKDAEIDDFIHEFKELDHFEFKTIVYRDISDYFSKFRENYRSISDSSIEDVLQQGTTAASEIASLKLNTFLESLNK